MRKIVYHVLYRQQSAGYIITVLSLWLGVCQTQTEWRQRSSGSALQRIDFNFLMGERSNPIELDAQSTQHTLCEYFGLRRRRRRMEPAVQFKTFCRVSSSISVDYQLVCRHFLITTRREREMAHVVQRARGLKQKRKKLIDSIRILWFYERR